MRKGYLSVLLYHSLLTHTSYVLLTHQVKVTVLDSRYHYGGRRTSNGFQWEKCYLTANPTRCRCIIGTIRYWGSYYFDRNPTSHGLNCRDPPKGWPRSPGFFALSQGSSVRLGSSFWSKMRDDYCLGSLGDLVVGGCFSARALIRLSSNGHLHGDRFPYSAHWWNQPLHLP